MSIRESGRLKEGRCNESYTIQSANLTWLFRTKILLYRLRDSSIVFEDLLSSIVDLMVTS
jgi:hypothetical protein